MFSNGNRALEEEIWDFLNMLRISDVSSHFIYGDGDEETHY
jgi:hypothetical protein